MVHESHAYTSKSHTTYKWIYQVSVKLRLNQCIVLPTEMDELEIMKIDMPKFRIRPKV